MKGNDGKLVGLLPIAQETEERGYLGLKQKVWKSDVFLFGIIHFIIFGLLVFSVEVQGVA